MATSSSPRSARSHHGSPNASSKAHTKHNTTTNSAAHAPPPPLPANFRNFSYRNGYVAQNGTVVQYQTDWTKQHQLEGDGLLTGLYDNLWKSDKTREHRLKTAMIPDTVVFEHNFPRAWYYYDLKTQEIVKRPGKLLDAKSIFESFSQEEGDCDIVAQFYYKRSPNAPNSSAAQGQKKHPASPSSVASSPRRPNTSPRKKSSSGSNNNNHAASSETALTTTTTTHHTDEGVSSAVEFFTKESLEEFLYNRKSKPDGVLQKFLIPKGKSSSRHNFTLQAVWSPMVTLVSKRSNNKLLGERANSVTDRAATFDGPPHLSAESHVAGSTKRRIEELCKAVVRHFHTTEHKRIVRIVLYFKEDDKDRLWLLWASSVRIGGDAYNPVTLRVPCYLAMNVETTEAHGKEESGQSMTSSRRRMDEALLERDIAMYDITGDLSFARMCGGDINTGGDAHVHDDDDDDDREEDHQSVSSSHRRRRIQNNATHSTHSRLNPKTSRELVVVDNESVTSSQHNQNKALVPVRPGYVPISNRAPFFALSSRVQAVGAESPRHPFHRKWKEVHDSKESEESKRNAKKDNSNDGDTQTESEKQQQRRDDFISTTRLSQQDIVRKELICLAHDAVYLAHSVALAATDDRAAGTDTHHVDIAPELKASFTFDQMEGLAEVMHLTPSDSGEEGLAYCLATGALTRGRRRDRPVAQLEQDVEAYINTQFELDGASIVDRFEAVRAGL